VGVSERRGWIPVIKEVKSKSAHTEKAKKSFKKTDQFRI